MIGRLEAFVKRRRWGNDLLSRAAFRASVSLFLSRAVRSPLHKEKGTGNWRMRSTGVLR
jgi:hypothetical protein